MPIAVFTVGNVYERRAAAAGKIVVTRTTEGGEVRQRFRMSFGFILFFKFS